MMSNFFHHPIRLILSVFLVLLVIFGLSQVVSLGVHEILAATAPPPFQLNCTHIPSSTLRGVQRPDFQTGIVSIEWGKDGYSHTNPNWQESMNDIQPQTGARWLEMPISFEQDSLTSTHIHLMPTTPDPNSFHEGICLAHMMGYHVFVVPLIGISTGTQRWVGATHFTSTTQTQQWFDTFWHVYQPYVQAAQQAHAEQVSIGTEYGWLEQNAPVALWNRLITRTQSIYTGLLTYDTNWSSLYQAPPIWMNNPALSKIGVSEYIALTQHRMDTLSKQQLASAWKTKIKAKLDAFALQLKKPLFLSEIGYRYTADALYNPWERQAIVPSEPALQATVCDVALSNVVSDPHITGIFFWAWTNTTFFDLHNRPAVSVLHKWYTSPAI